MYFAVVVLTVGTHFAYPAYLPSGGFLALRWPRTILLHVPPVVGSIGVVAVRLCALSSPWKRRMASNQGGEYPVCRDQV